MLTLIAGLALFMLAHSVSILAPAWRDQTAARIGSAPWRGVYSLVSIAGFALIVWGFGSARQALPQIYQSPEWLKIISVVLMAGAFPLLFATYLPGRLSAGARHPMLAAVKLWAMAHLLANGGVADVLLFGSFLAWAVADRISLKRRAPRPIRTLPPSRYNDAIAIAAGLAVYAAFLGGLHLRLFGVQPPI
jgi:uncharacterized membrane protein